jgi:hypothetical protein
MITDIESPEKKDICFFQNFELKIDENYNNNVTLPINGEKILKETNHLNNNDITKNYSNILLSDNFYQLEFDDISNEELYFINKQISPDKKNETISSTDTNSKNNNQELFLSKKRDNTNKIKRKKEHSKFEKDNVMRKLNIHFISFIVKFVNFNIKKLLSKDHPLFTNLCYDFKKKLNNTTFNELKNKTIGEVLKNEGSNKNKRNMVYEKDDNEKIYNSVHNTILKELLDINYIQFFRQVYTQGSNGNYLDIYINYKAPKKILFFDDFIKKEIQKDKINGELYKERLKYISKSEFISEGYPFFETKTYVKNKNKK